jgi:putative ABC transport system permease protein
MSTLLSDVRYAARTLRKNPGFTAAAVLSLALGIGANTAIFSVVDAALLRPLPYAEPDGLVLAWGASRATGHDRNQVSFTDTVDWRAQNTVFEELSAYDSWTPLLSGSGEPERVAAALVGEGFFGLMRARPLVGRLFTAEEQVDGHDRVVVLSYGMWQRRFGGDPGVVGASLSLNGSPHTVVGVLPADFHSLPSNLLDAPADLYRPLGEVYDDAFRSNRHMRAIARLAPGVTLERAQAEMDLITRRLEREHELTNVNYGVRLASLREDLVGNVRPALLALLGAVALVLLIACANVANLLLARMGARRRELAVRAALGATRARLVRQALTESLLLALAGGAVGLLLAAWCVGAIELLGSEILVLANDVRIDPRVLGFTLAVAAATGVAFGLAPALQGSAPDLTEALKDGARGATAGPGRGRLRSALVVAEVAMTLVLLVGAGLLVKTVGRLQGVDPGFDPQNAVSMNVWLPAATYPNGESRMAFFDRLLERVAALPGVEAAGVTNVLPSGSNFDRFAVEAEGQPRPPGEGAEVDRYVVSQGYLRAMRIPVLRGRALTERDGPDAPPVVLVNETLARSLWPGEDAVGKRVRSPQTAAGEERPWLTVVGVVGDVRQYGLDRPATRQVYFPYAQSPRSAMTLVVRAPAESSGLVAAVRREVLAVDPNQAVFDVATLEQVLADSIALRRLATILLGLFTAVALALAAVGVYGVVAYTAAQRTHEIGIRMALGARPEDVLRLVVGQGMRLAIAGIVVGLVAARVLSGLLESLLFEVRAADPAIYAAGAAIAAAVAAAACAAPAARAARVDPMVALRHE